MQCSSPKLGLSPKELRTLSKICFGWLSVLSNWLDWAGNHKCCCLLRPALQGFHISCFWICFFIPFWGPFWHFSEYLWRHKAWNPPAGANPRPVVSCGPQALVLIIQRMEAGFSATSRGQTQMSVYQETMAGHAAHYVGLNRCFPLPPYAAGSPGSTQNSLRWLWPLSSTSQISRWVFLLPIWICIITSPMTITGA